MIKMKPCFSIIITWMFCSAAFAFAESGTEYEYHLLATNRTSTMQKEMTESASHGYRFKTVMGGETSFGGSQVTVIMEREYDNIQLGRFKYRLLATNKTSTMQKELQSAADQGFFYCGQTIFSSTFGGEEVVVILERDRETADKESWEYLLLGTNKTSTMQKELEKAASDGFEVTGMTIGNTSFGGNELVTILRRPAAKR